MFQWFGTVHQAAESDVSELSQWNNEVFSNIIPSVKWIEVLCLCKYMVRDNFFTNLYMYLSESWVWGLKHLIEHWRNHDRRIKGNRVSGDHRIKVIFIILLVLVFSCCTDSVIYSQCSSFKDHPLLRCERGARATITAPGPKFHVAWMCTREVA